MHAAGLRLLSERRHDGCQVQPIDAQTRTFPTLTKEQSTDEKFEKITSYLYMLLEQLRYSMGNLDKENFNDAGLEEIANIITEPVYVQLEG